MTARRRSVLSIVVLLAIAAPARSARGQGGAPADHTNASATPPGIAAVEIAVVGTAADLERVRKLFGAGGLAGATPRWVVVPRFDPLEVVREHRRPEQRTVRCWVDISSPERTRLFFAAGSGERFLVRVLPISSHSDEMDQQALAEVLERSVSALLDDAQAGLDRAQAQALLESRWRRETKSPAPARVPPTTSPVKRSHTFHLSGAVFYAGQALPLARSGGSAVALLHGPGLSLTGSVRWGQRRWGIWAAAQRQFSHREQTNDVGLDFQTNATRAGLELQQALGDAHDRGFRLSHVLLRVGSGLDLVQLTPLPGTVDQSATLTSARWSSSLVLTAAVGAGLHLGRRVSLAVAVFADFLPTNVHYDFAVDGQSTRVLSPGRLRPGVALELAADVL